MSEPLHYRFIRQLVRVDSGGLKLAAQVSGLLLGPRRALGSWCLDWSAWED